jgi:hypothetical protein
MKKIKNISQLQTEKKRIKQQQNNIENVMRSNWKELKEQLSPLNFAKAAIGKVISTKQEENLNSESVFKNTFTYGVSLLAKKFADKAGEKLDKILKK